MAIKQPFPRPTSPLATRRRVYLGGPHRRDKPGGSLTTCLSAETINDPSSPLFPNTPSILQRPPNLRSGLQLLSTGLADWMDIQRAIDGCRQEGNDRIVLLQCTSLYPAPAYLSNLRAMRG